MTFTYTTLDQAKQAVRDGLADVAGDNPDMNEDDYAADIVEAMAYECDAETAYELCRTELGWVPVGLKRVRPDVAKVEAREDRRHGHRWV